MKPLATVRVLTADDLEQVRAFYREVGYGDGADATDLILGADLDGELSAVVRLSTEHGATVLRGMYVAPRHRRLGIGRLLLTALQPHLPPEPCYCLPFSHLADFYAEAGFVQVAHTELPMHLRQRAEGHLDRGLDIIAMRRGASEVH